MSKGHTLFSDDHGASWHIGSAEFGAPFLSNECQATELANSSVLINARTFTNNRIQVISNDGGVTFDAPYIVHNVSEPLEGCAGSIVRHTQSNLLYHSIPFTTTLTRVNMTVFVSADEGLNWAVLRTVDEGAVAYSSLTVDYKNNVLELLYERSDVIQTVFDPDEIRYVRITL